MSEVTVRQLTGVCSAITERNGWTEFEIDHGGQHTTKVSTKLQPLVELGRAAGANLAVWTFKESDGNENPNRPGTFYKNRYLEGVEVGGAVVNEDPVTVARDINANEGPAAQQPRPPVLGGDKDRLIVRQTCIKAAASLYQGQGYWSLTGNADEIADTPLAIINAAARFETWVYRDLDEPPF